ncbi:hypothetical protein ASPFODRAFT_144603 [Aspergillus luchuensis CBS 106.47]|uniref:Uncharacterized protein n=1 Tax=Aspergillus luchuensis (strain CBS 106.47) TaxID=1137211 RepID=A0A1M3T5F6_ASPLC|nr:hypothetical protein ASPFODRAFT_144603 [Aspergillus luchuensis CBS 106.47]
MPPARDLSWARGKAHIPPTSANLAWIVTCSVHLQLNIHTRFLVPDTDLLCVPIGDYERVNIKRTFSVHWIYFV